LSFSNEKKVSFGFLSNALFWKTGNDKTVKAKNLKNTAFSPYWQKLKKKRKKDNSFACCSIMFSIMKNIVHVSDTEKNKTRIFSNFRIRPTRL